MFYALFYQDTYQVYIKGYFLFGWNTSFKQAYDMFIATEHIKA